MSELIQFSVGDGTIDWSPGQTFFGPVWDHVEDKLRFHKGQGFVIINRENSKTSREFKLAELEQPVREIVQGNKVKTVIEIRSKLDDFRMLMRRIKVPDDKGQMVIAQAAAREGTPYDFGTTDCSWLTQQCVLAVTGILLPHNAAMQRADSRVRSIARAQLKPGDLVFIDDLHHVAIYLDDMFGGRVWDTEPHSTSVPGNWMPDNDGQLGTGVRIRPMFLPWYCGQIDSYGRIEAVNG
jgi:cell wall-associated NlpC family hydrolase